MNRIALTTSLAASLLFAAAAMAQAPAGAPAGTTGACKDGTYTSAASKKGACRGHQGVKEWYAASGATPANAPAPAAAAKPANAAAASGGGATSGATGVCKDGTMTSAASKKGACRGHQGVKEWYGAASAAAPVAAAAPAPAAPATAPMAAPAPVAAPTAPATTAMRPAYTPAAVAAPGGGAGQVWVNKSTKVYHCQNDKWYGKTKSGEYMSEADAKAKGFHADHGKDCSQ